MYACLKRGRGDLLRQPDRAQGLVIVMSDGMSETPAGATPPCSAQGRRDPGDRDRVRRRRRPRPAQEVAEATGGAFVQQDDLVAALRQAAGYK